MYLSVVFFVRSTTFLEAYCGLFPSGSAILRPEPWQGSRLAVSGRAYDHCRISQIMIAAPIFWLAALFVLVLLRALLRKEWAAAVAWVLLFSVFGTAQSEFGASDLAGTLIFFALAVFCLIRFGLLTLVTNFVLYGVLRDFSSDDAGFCVVCRHQSGRNYVDGRDSALCLLHLSGRPTGFRRCRPRGVSCRGS